MLPVIGFAHDHAAANDWINDWTMADFGPHKKSMTGISKVDRPCSGAWSLIYVAATRATEHPNINPAHNLQQQTNNKSF